MSGELPKTYKTGRAGERLFEHLCDEADLFVSRREPDMTGKDRFVEFPLAEHNPDISYDKRHAPLQAYVQIKSSAGIKMSAPISLSNAERLCRDVNPAFLFVAQRRDELVTTQYLIHIDEKIISKTLRRLRIAQATGQKSIHKININISFSNDDIVRDAFHLREKFVSHIGSDLFEYAQRKSNLLKNLGYDGSKMKINLEFDHVTVDDYLDGLLGLKELPIKKLETSEIRFDIELPDHGAKSGKILINQKEIECNIKGYDLNGLQLWELQGRMKAAALDGDPKKRSKMLIETSMFNFLFHGNSFKVWTPDERPKKQLFLNWVNGFSCWHCITEGNFNLKIQIEDKEINLPAPPITHNERELNEITSTINLLKDAISIKSFDKFHDCDVDLDDLIENAEEIKKAALYLNPDREKTSKFSVTGPGHSEFSLPTDTCLVIQPVIIGDELFIYATKSKLSLKRLENSTLIEMHDEILIACEKIEEPFVENIERFRAKLTRMTGLSLVLQRTVEGEEAEIRSNSE